MSKLVYIGFTFRHHRNTQAGYQHIKDYLPYDYVFNTDWEFDLLFYKQTVWYKKCLSFFIKHTLGRGCPLTVIKCILLSLVHRNIIFHFIYAEGNYKWLHHFLGKTNKVVCSFHQPANVLHDAYGWRKDLPHINKVILLSENDISQFEDWTHKRNVEFIPHGINTEFYAPASNVPKMRNILMVGNWLRDFEFANDVFSDMLDSDEQLTVTIVADERNFSFFIPHSRLVLKTCITDQELRLLYQQSYIVFLPLSSYTANNAIMEAVATGCQIVIATNRADTSYFGVDRIDILPLDKDMCIAYLFDRLNTVYPQLRVKANRKFVEEQYSWPRIADETYKYLINW